ncbi:hypothetical protein CDL15_Pgr002810 [Punica granatum]|uniref:Uncharacterized protein n=1 Tax=Punica granatum TaxID=22663 RepID=A0A218X1N9_PUNGR|nr:hypothetical protein CDL15_Pgr002810 [Punica granatum]
MSALENIVGSKLKLKGEALDVKAVGVKKKKRNHNDEHRPDDAAAGLRIASWEEDQSSLLFLA